MTQTGDKALFEILQTPVDLGRCSKMNTENKIPFRPSYPWHLFALIVTTVFAIVVSLYYLNAGRFIVFQNLFYFPIIIACVYYLRKGFVFSILLAFIYLFLILAYTSNSTIIREAFIRVAIFIMVAGVVSFLSLKQKRSEEGQNRDRSWREGINRILGLVLEPVPFDETLKRITDGVVETFGADFCRIWIIGKGDLCGAGCMHAEVLEEPHVCQYRDNCLHLKASSGRYTHIDGKAHRRVPFGAYKIGRIASGEEMRFLTNDVQRDPRVHDHEWAKSLGLAAFAGYRLRPPDGETLGVLALFTKFEISPDMDATLEGLSRAIALVIQKDIAERALAESEDRYRAVVEDQTEIISRFRTDGTLTFVNDVFCRFFAQEEEDILGTRWQPNAVPDDMPEIGPKLATLSPSNPVMVIENRVYDGNGTVRWMQFVNRGFFDELWQLTEIQSVGRDITERRRAEEALLNSEQKLKAVVYGSPIPQFVIDRDHQVVYWNNALEEITGIRASEVIGTNQHWRAFYGAERPCMADLVVDGDIERIPELYQGKYSRSKLVASAYEATDYFPALGEDGKWLFFTAAAIRDVSGQVIGALETLEDVTERKQAEEEILTLSITDQLTGLHNRRGFITLADQQLKLSNRAKRGMLLFFADLDGMKWINDTLGHEEGDKALIEVAAILRETFRSSDIIARMGGDEFAILAIDSTEVNSEILTTRLQEKIDTNNRQENRRYRLSISVGCSCYDPENPCSLDELMAHADTLMYEHKRIKKSCQ